MSYMWLLIGCAPYLIFIVCTLHAIDKVEMLFKPPKGKAGLPAWHKENHDGISKST